MADDLIPAKRPRVTHEEAAKMLRLQREGLSHKQIADAVKRDLSTVYDTLRPFISTVEQARATLEAAAAPAAESWVIASKIAAAKGEHKPAKDLLAAVGAITEQAQTQVAVQVNMPGAGESGRRNAMPDELASLDIAVSATESDS
jgi:hypothetical protein